MILQSLYALFNRLSEDPANGLPKPGYSIQNITFRVVLRLDGSLVEIQDARQEDVQIGKNGREKKTLRPLPLLVPGQARPSEASFDSCLLWDDTRFVFGWHGVKEDVERNSKCFESFKRRHFEMERDLADPDFSAVCSFLRGWKPSFAQSHPSLLSAKKGRAVFQISGRTKYVHENESIRDWVENNLASRSQDSVKGQCLVTGEAHQNLARLHPGIHGIPGSPYTGAGLVSFNLSAFSSFERDQGFNSPVSEAAAFAYCNALNFLLASKSRRFRIGDATTVFWTDQPTPAEDLLPWMMSGVEDEEAKKRIQAILEKISQGTLAADDLGSAQTRYYILGLSLNQGRLSVRFWHTGTIAELTANLKLHFDHLWIVRQWDETNSKNPEPIAPTAYQLLRQTSRDSDGIPPLLGGALMRSILLGTRYPESLINGVMNRIRVVEKNPRREGALDNVPYLRAAILKAWLIRNHQPWLQQHNITMTTALDKENPSAAYQLGRLFAVYEQVQRAAHEFKLERTIRETMFSAASATPLSVFGRLDRLNKHHLAKLKVGSNNFYSDLIGEIHQKVRAPGFYPASLNLKEQSIFCIGYYHQRHDLRYKQETSATPETV